METWAILIIVALGYAASFGAGYWLCKSRYSGLGKNTELCPDVSGDLEKDADRAGDLADELDEIISAGDDITDIFKRVDESNKDSGEKESQS